MRGVFALLALAASVGAAGAATATDAASVQDIARAITAQTNELRRPDAAQPDALAARMQQIARQITDHTEQQATKRLAAESAQDNAKEAQQVQGRQIYLFVSRSLKTAALKDIFLTISDTSVTAVFRGIPEGARINESNNELYQMIRGAGIDPIPAITLNPKRWRELDVQSVPTMVMVDGDREIARVSGLTNPAWLREQVEAGQTGDLGVRGPIAEPSEPDLITVMQERASRLDFAKLRDKAAHSYWKRAPVFEIPSATRDKRRKVDLRMRVSRDITTPDGTVIARKGAIVNPLDTRAFTLRLLVFDATRPEQVAFAESQSGAHPDTILLVSRFDNDRGWKGYERLSERFDKPVYRLTQDVLSRFNVHATPAVIHADQSGQVVVDEHYIQSKPTGTQHED